jgi:2-methylcitrate dehydratase PrpD
MLVIENDPSLPRGVSCHLTVTMKDGKKMEVQVDYPKGSPQNPMTEAERYAKFEGLSRKLLNDSQRKKIVSMIQELDKVKDITEFTSLLIKN